MPNTMTWKGSWVGDGSNLSVFAYIKNDTVKHNGIVYVSTANNVPIGSPSPDLDMSNWDVVVIDGTSGNSGVSGSSGTSGNTGTSGTSGENGTSGTSGGTGSSGTSGETGTSGTSGTSGGTGSSGTSGADGNEYGFYYRISGSTTEADPSSGRLRFNNLVQPDSTFIYIDRFTVLQNNDLQDFFTGLSNYGDSNFRGLLTITSATDNTFFHVYNFSTIQDMGGWFKIGISRVYSEGSFILPTQEYVYVRFSPTSTPGTSGTSGETGAAGTSGTSGGTGASGTSGSSGTSGNTGAAGSSGTSGNTGDAGSSGSSGTSGNSGTSGTAGSSGSTGTSGNSGTSGSSGTAGSSGSTGTSGSTGSSGSSGMTGTSGTSGAFTGTLTFTQGTDIPSAASINDYNISAGSLFSITGTTSSSITGFANGVIGRYMLIVNNTDKNQTFQQENTGSLASNRLVLGVSNKTIGINQTATFIYVGGLTIGASTNQSRWILTATT